MADKLVKLMDETGYRQLINMLISIKSSQQEDVEKCISIWQPSTTYQKDKVVLVVNDATYSEYICKATHVSGETFNETYWTLVSCVDFEGYTEEELMAMLNLSEIELQNLQSILRNDEISTRSAWSSSKVYAELLTVLSESKNFTIAEIAKIVSFSYKVVTSESEVVDDKAIYLIENATTGTYDMYLLVDNSPSKIGNTNINLEGYVKKENIIDTFDETTIYADSDKVFSTKATKEALDTKLNKSAIVTTLDNTVTDEQVASAKITYNNVKKVMVGETINESSTLPQDIRYFPLGKYTFRTNAVAQLYTELPVNTSGELEIFSPNPDVDLTSTYCYRVYRFTDLNGTIYTRSLNTGATAGVISYDAGWKKVNTDITTTLNSSCTDEQVASALATYNAIKDWDSAYNWDYVNSTSLNINLSKAGLYKFSTITEGAPNDNPGDYTLLNIPWKKSSDTIRYGTQLLFSPRVQHFYFRRIWDYIPSTYVYTEGDYSVFGKWNVCGQSNAYTLGYETSLITQIPENGDLNNYTTAGVYICKSYAIGATLSNAPNKTKNHAFKLEVNCMASGICQQRILALNNSEDIFEFSRTRSTAGTWSVWKKVCYTSIEDIELTSLVPTDTTNYYNADTTSTVQSSHYCVKNGICTINVGLSCTTPSTSFVTLFNGLPKPKAKYTFRAFAHSSTSGITQVNINITTNGAFLINGGTEGIVWYTATISYPVAE